MKTISFLIILSLVCISSCKTTKPGAGIKPEVTKVPVSVAEDATQQVNFSDQATWLLGYFNLDRLTISPHSEWYIKGYDEYQPENEVVKKLQNAGIDNLQIKIIMGSWCPDSRREVPRFMRVLDIWRFPMSRVNFIGVDNSKLSPVAEYDSLHIERVPTFIIYKNNIEAGRIIENPVTSLEQDMLDILTRKE
jgi:thiol-disulfide isomerase/thioredoxin